MERLNAPQLETHYLFLCPPVGSLQLLATRALGWAKSVSNEECRVNYRKTSYDCLSKLTCEPFYAATPEYVYSMRLKLVVICSVDQSLETIEKGWSDVGWTMIQGYLSAVGGVDVFMLVRIL